LLLLVSETSLESLAQFGKYLPRNPIIVPPCGHLRTRNVLLISENIVFPDGVAPGAIHMKRHHIHKIYRHNSEAVRQSEITKASRVIESLGGRVMDVGSLVISPGVVDIHTHLNEPGRYDWEGIGMGTSAAAAGGVTTIVDMPINSYPAITTAESLRHKVRRAWVRAPLATPSHSVLMCATMYQLFVSAINFCLRCYVMAPPMFVITGQSSFFATDLFIQAHHEGLRPRRFAH
jgi:hypothetical protein